MRLVDLGNICKAVETTESETKVLENLLRIEDEGKVFSKAYKNNYWDGYHYFFNPKTGAFPSGLLHIVQKRFPNAAYVPPDRVPYRDTFTELANLTPREDQVELITTALKARRGIIQAPTSYGKSACMAMLCLAIPGNVLVLTHTKALLYQTAKDLERETGEPIGIIGDGRANQERITIGLIKSVMDLQLDPILGILVDECHRCSADMLYKYILSLPAHYRFGLSADPLDEQNVKANSLYKRFRIMACFGPVVAKFSMDQAKAQGIVAKPNITMKRIPDTTGGKFRESSYQEAYDGLIVFNTGLHQAVKEICDQYKDSQIMILLRRIDHGKQLEALLPNSRFLSGELDSTTLNSAIDEYRKGKYSTLIGSDIFKEGVNIPEVDVLINAGGDVAASKQRLGRGLRRREGKDTVQVFDFLICGNPHIERHCKERLRIYLSDGHPVNNYTSPMVSDDL